MKHLTEVRITQSFTFSKAKSPACSVTANPQPVNPNFFNSLECNSTLFSPNWGEAATLYFEHTSSEVSTG
jgi:hypothetical protein